MKLQHALGGLENLGPVTTETRVFVEDWERRIFGIHTAMMAMSDHLGIELPTSFRDTWTWASLRTGAEAMQPFEYFKFRYYEKWLMGISQFFIDGGYVTAAELIARTDDYRATPDAPLPQACNAHMRAQIRRYLTYGDSPRRADTLSHRFRAGDRVRVADPAVVAHTRLPGYLRNKTGTIDHVYEGAFAYFVPTGADGLGGSMHVYRVAFDAAEIWGTGLSEPNTVIYADLFAPYIDNKEAL